MTAIKPPKPTHPPQHDLKGSPWSSLLSCMGWGRWAQDCQNSCTAHLLCTISVSPLPSTPMLPCIWKEEGEGGRTQSMVALAIAPSPPLGPCQRGGVDLLLQGRQIIPIPSTSLSFNSDGHCRILQPGVQRICWKQIFWGCLEIGQTKNICFQLFLVVNPLLTSQQQPQLKTGNSVKALCTENRILHQQQTPKVSDWIYVF